MNPKSFLSQSKPMHLSFRGTPTISATRRQVWDRLMDPDVVAQSTPGMESVERIAEGRFRIHSSVGLGILALRLVLDAEIIDPVAPYRASLLLRGTVQGSEIDVRSTVELEETGPGSVLLHWEATTEIRGPLARLGPEMLGGAARLFTEKFWNDFAQRSAVATA